MRSCGFQHRAARRIVAGRRLRRSDRRIRDSHRAQIEDAAYHIMFNAAVHIPEDYENGIIGHGARRAGHPVRVRARPPCSRTGRSPGRSRDRSAPTPGCRDSSSKPATSRGSRAASWRWRSAALGHRPRDPRGSAAAQPGPPLVAQVDHDNNVGINAPEIELQLRARRRRGSTSPRSTRAGCSAPTTACSFRATASTASSDSSST